MELDNLLLLSGNDIPFEKGRITIHPPTISEISFIGEEAFFVGCQLIVSGKSYLNTADNFDLDRQSNFEILLTVMGDKGKQTLIQQNYIRMVFALLLPAYQINVERDAIQFVCIDNPEQSGYLNKDNFEDFRQLLTQVFCLKDTTDITEFNPAGPLAQKLAEKFRQRHKKLAELKGGEGKKKISILSRYISILSVGLGISIKELNNYTIYQLLDCFNRYMAFLEHDIYQRACLAGAVTKMKQPEDWMRDFKDDDNKNEK